MKARQFVGGLVREPLVHFLALGAALFLLFGLTRETDQPSERRIVVTAGQVEQLAGQFSRTWMRPPTEAELASLVERHIRNEVFYREAQALGLGEDDPYVRNRLALKLQFVLDDLSAEAEPTDAELQRFLDEHAEQFTVPARLSFSQVYLNPDRHPDPAAEVRRVLEALRGGADAAGLGDPSLLPSRFDDATLPEIAREFGEEFADELAEVQPDRWSGPVPSPFGIHLVFVTDREPGRQLPLEEVRPAVLAEWQDQRREQAREEAYQRMRDRYEVVIEPEAQAGAVIGSNPANQAAARPGAQGSAGTGGPRRDAAEGRP
ncbi:MAG: peptidylprolyl isomerase [Gammaproteobacteria bacterium]